MKKIYGFIALAALLSFSSCRAPVEEEKDFLSLKNDTLSYELSSDVNLCDDFSNPVGLDKEIIILKDTFVFRKYEKSLFGSDLYTNGTNDGEVNGQTIIYDNGKIQFFTDIGIIVVDSVYFSEKDMKNIRAIRNIAVSCQGQGGSKYFYGVTGWKAPPDNIYKYMPEQEDEEEWIWSNGNSGR
ncbi:MAG: hypothetical protein JXR30_02670 [Alphaproteobacteria bacterium]|nr:hypothetical protein [Alphaproteobacteria bacterium]